MKADSNSRVDAALAERLFRQAKAERWRLPQAAFTAALETSCAKAFPAAIAAPRRGLPLPRRRFISKISRWPVRAPSATARHGTTSCWRCGQDSIVPPTRSIDPGRHESSPTRCTPISTGSTSGAARASRCCATFTAAAASPRGCVPCSRSAMSTACASIAAPSRCRRSWQAARRPQPPTPTAARFVDMLRSALEIAVARLEPRDRLRLRCYYAQQLTLAQTGTLLKEHEATTSRQLARTRKIIRDECRTRAPFPRAEGCARSRGVSSARPKTWARPTWTRCWTYGPAEASAESAFRRTRDPQEIVTRSFYMKREPMGNEREPGQLAGHDAAADAGNGVRCVSRRRDAGGLG